MEVQTVLREIADKTSDVLLVAVLFGLQAAVASGFAANWFV